MKKTLYLEAFTAIALLVFCCSCGKESVDTSKDGTAFEVVDESDNFQSSAISLPMENVDLQIEVRNGRLVFDNIEHLSTTLTYFSDNEQRHFTREALDNWEQSIGFQSSRNEFEQIVDELKNIDSEEGLQSFKSEYSDKVEFDGDDFPQPKKIGSLSSVMENEYYSLIMGEELHFFKGNLQVAFPLSMIDMLPEIYQNPFNFESLGVYVVDTKIASSELDFRMPCGDSNSRSCSDTEGKKRVKGDWYLEVLFGNAYTSGNQLVRDFKFQYHRRMQSHKKGFWGIGWDRNHHDDIQWGTGYGIQYDMPSITTPCTGFVHKENCGGTGWTQNSWSISSSLILEDWYTMPANLPGSCQVPNNFEFLYNNNFVQNNDVSNLFCEDDCWVRGCN